MPKKEIFIDPSIIEKIVNRKIRAPYLDLGGQQELCKTLREQTTKKNKLLDRIYTEARQILSASQHKVFIAVFKHGYKIPALARAHGIKRSTYYTHYYRALDKLRIKLVEGGIVKKKNMRKDRVEKIFSRNWKPF